MEEDLKMSKMEYLSNPWLINLCLSDQPKVEDNLEWETTIKIKRGISLKLLI